MFTTSICTNKMQLVYEVVSSLDQLQIKNFNFASWKNPLYVVGCRFNCQLKIGASNDPDPAITGNIKQPGHVGVGLGTFILVIYLSIPLINFFFFFLNK